MHIKYKQVPQKINLKTTFWVYYFLNLISTVHSNIHCIFTTFPYNSVKSDHAVGRAVTFPVDRPPPPALSAILQQMF
jgi:hypothetical protein